MLTLVCTLTHIQLTPIPTNSAPPSSFYQLTYTQSHAHLKMWSHSWTTSPHLEGRGFHFSYHLSICFHSPEFFMSSFIKLTYFYFCSLCCSRVCSLPILNFTPRFLLAHAVSHPVCRVFMSSTRNQAERGISSS
jgi:hypothetical protein